MKTASDLIQEIEVNDKQADFLEAVFFGLDAKEVVKTAGIVGGIGSGKSFSMAMLMIMSKEELPKAKGQFACLTITQFKRSIFPGIKSVWMEHFGLKEYNEKTGQGNFVLWKKPPDDWDVPYQEPEDWENCVAFPNGWVIEACAYKLNPDIHRGRNDDFIFCDEGLLIKREWLKIMEGRVRANKGKFESNLHWLFAFFSSPPYGSGGDWMFEVEEFMKNEPDKYFFTQITTKDNAAFLPANYISNLKKKLTRIEYEVEVEGKRLSKMPRGFYPSLDLDKHSNIDEDNFYDEYKGVEASVDFNAHFTSCTIWQDWGDECHCIMNVFVKEPDADMTMSETLAREVARRLAGHERKVIVVTGDRNGNNISAGSKKMSDGDLETFFDQFGAVMDEEGWDTTLDPLNYNPQKDDVFLTMQDVLSERDPEQLRLRFHPVNAKSTLVSMQFSPITTDYRKVKASESKSTVQQENATHLGDTVDYYVVWKKNGGVGQSGSFDIDFL
jgi:predicted RNA-binding protein with PIN domain